MIYFLEGQVGSGKTYHMVNEIIIPNLKEGKRIYNNVPLRVDNIESEFFQLGYCLDRVFTLTQENFKTIIQDPEKFSKSLFVIDECHDFFWSHKGLSDEQILKFFAMHRHHLCHIILASQDRDKVAKKNCT